MRASMSVHAPIARERRRHALRARTVRVAVEKCEIRRHEVRP